MAKAAVVTGVSSGIGRAIAACLIEEGWHVFGSVRKQDDAAAASEAFGEAFTPLLCDVTEEASITAAVEKVGGALAGKTLNGLVNNAGIPAAGPMRYVPIDDLKHVFDVNVHGVVRMCQAFIPMLGAEHDRTGEPGKIINVSSLSGKLSVPFMGPYSMSKYAVEAMSDAMRVELRPHGIDVIVIEPGPVKTAIFSKTEALDFGQYKDTEYFDSLERVIESSQRMSKGGLEPEAIGRLVVQIFDDPSPKPRYSVLKNKLSRWVLPRLLPSRTLDRILAKRVGLPARKK